MKNLNYTHNERTSTTHILLVTALLLLFLPGLAPPLMGEAFDWGVTLDNFTTINYSGGDDTALSQRNKAAVWAETRWVSENNNRFILSGQGSFLYTNEPLYLFDIDRLVLRARFPGLLGEATVADASFGRFRFMEPTGLVMNHPADGVSFMSDHGEVRWGFSLGYTGLLLKPEAGIEMSSEDTADKTDEGVYFAPRRLLQIGELTFPRLPGRQSLTVAAVAQQDLRGLFDDDTADDFHSLHGLLSLSGPIPVTPGVYYNLDAGLSYDISDMDNMEKQLAFMGRGRLRYFNEGWGYSRFALGLLFTSEDFFAVSTPSLAVVHAPALDNLLRVTFDYSARPWGNRMAPALRNLMFTTAGRLFFTPLDSSGDDAAGAGYQGAEIEAGISVRPAVDLGFAMKGGVFIPQEGDINGLLRFELSVSF